VIAAFIRAILRRGQRVSERDRNSEPAARPNIQAFSNESTRERRVLVRGFKQDGSHEAPILSNDAELESTNGNTTASR